MDEALAYFYYPQFGNRSWGGAARRGIQQLQGSPTKVCVRNYTPDLRNTYINMGVTVLLERPRS